MNSFHISNVYAKQLTRMWLEETVLAFVPVSMIGEEFRLLLLLMHHGYMGSAELVALAAKILSFVEAYDLAAEDASALSVAQMRLDDILNSPSLQAASSKIDQLAKRQELDSTLMLLITKAWAAAKESTMMKDEVWRLFGTLLLVHAK